MGRCGGDASQNPRRDGYAPDRPLNFYIATKRANKGSKRRFDFEELEIIRQPVLIGEKTAAKKLVDDNVVEERARYLAEKMELRRQVAEQTALDKLRKEEEEKRLQTAYLVLYQSTPKKFGPSDVGKTFQVRAIGESYGRYGAYYFLRTDQGVYYSDPTSKRSIPNILRYVRQDTHKGRKIYSLLGKEIYSIKVEAWRRASHSGYYYAATTLSASSWLKQKVDEKEALQQGDEMPEEWLCSKEPPVDPFALRTIDYQGKPKDLVRLESLDVGSTIEVVGICTKIFNRRETHVYLGKDGKYYRGSYFSMREVGENPKGIFSLVPKGLRITPTKGREMAVEVVKSSCRA